MQKLTFGRAPPEGGSGFPLQVLVRPSLRAFRFNPSRSLKQQNRREAVID